MIGEIRWFTIIEQGSPITSKWGAYRVKSLKRLMQPVHIVSR